MHMAKETYLYGIRVPEVCVSVKRDLDIWQMRPTLRICVKLGLRDRAKETHDHAKETY